MSPVEKHSAQINVRVTASEDQRYRALADQRNVRLSDWARDAFYLLASIEEGEVHEGSKP
jgi:hypothetical protein